MSDNLNMTGTTAGKAESVDLKTFIPDKLTIQWPTEQGHNDKRLHRKIKIEQHKRHKNI
jgi:hypothetical protein